MRFDGGVNLFFHVRVVLLRVVISWEICAARSFFINTSHGRGGGVVRFLWVTFGLSVGFGLAVCVGVAVDVALGVSVGVAVAVEVAVGVGVALAVVVGVAVGVGVVPA